MKKNSAIYSSRLTTVKKSFTTALLQWYAQAKRDLPWRHTRDPYAIWLSETMLQQTQVETVKPFYHKFLARFPTLPELATADLQEVLTLWAGMGYYRRARNLHAAAQKMVAEHAGLVPREIAQLLDLPGVGRYTAGAVASIAYGVQAAVLDGNVMRVLTRLEGIGDDLGRAQVQQRLWVMADALVDEQEPGDYNQALMELGARVCVPRQPRCMLCPLRELCTAHREGTQEYLPVKEKKGKVLVVKRTMVLLLREQDSQTGTPGGLPEALREEKGPNKGGRGGVAREKRGVRGLEEGVRGVKNTEILLLKRPLGGVWEEMWEFPALKMEVQVNLLTQIADTLQRLLEGEIGRSVGGKVALAKKPLRVRQRLTHRLMDCVIYVGRVTEGAARAVEQGGAELPVCELAGRPYQAFRWISPERLADLPVTQLTRKIAQAAGVV